MTDIVYVDDQSGFLDKNSLAGVVTRFDPLDDVDLEEAAKAAETAFLWVFDFFYGDEPRIDIGDKNGPSVFESWRGALRGNRPLSVVVSSHLEEALGPGPPHQLVRRTAVDWVASKDDFAEQQILRLSACSKAIAEMHDRKATDPSTGNGIITDAELLHLLSVGEETDWAQSALRQIDQARPPTLSTALSGRGFAREIMTWLTQQILPYPSFLIRLPHVAARLRISLDALKDLLNEDSPLTAALKECEYAGPLAGFDDQMRWWRPGIDEILLRLSETTTYDAGICKLAQREVELLPFDEPVVVADADLQETEDIADAKDCVRAEDEYLPAHVDALWVRLSDARKDAGLRAKVVFEDQPLLVQRTNDDH